MKKLRGALVAMVVWGLVAWSSHATAAPDDALTIKEAKEAVNAIAEHSGEVAASRQGVLAASALAEPSGRLPVEWKNTVKAFATVDPAMVQAITFAALEELAPDFAKQKCGKPLPALESLSAEGIATTCKLKQQKLLPSGSLKTLRGGALLFAALAMTELKKRKASPEEITLAAWLSYLGRRDADAPGVKKP